MSRKRVFIYVSQSYLIKACNNFQYYFHRGIGSQIRYDRAPKDIMHTDDISRRTRFVDKTDRRTDLMNPIYEVGRVISQLLFSLAMLCFGLILDIRCIFVVFFIG